MRAIFYERFGGPEVLRFGYLPTPAAGPGEVLIRVRAAGVNPIDWKLCEGFAEGMFPYQFPIVPGWEAAGEIASLGADAVGFEIGDPVFTYCRRPVVQWGSYADFVPVAAQGVAPKPERLTMVEAAAVPLTALTAWQALAEHMRLQQGQTVLIHAGAGGVGSFAIPIAKHLGARVLTTASAANADYVRALGADMAIDYRCEDWAATVRQHYPDGIDAVLDSLGGAASLQSLALIRRDGVIVCLNEPVEEDVAASHGVRCHRLFVTPDGASLRRIAGLIDTGALPLPPVQVMPLAEAAQAFALSKAGHVRGKLVLDLG
ncbi:MAG: NADP-dependent oxidoreductase [Sphingomonadales bacterium]